MNFTAETPPISIDVLKLGAVAASTGFGLGFKQRFVLASFEIDPAGDLTGLAARLEQIGAPHVLVTPDEEEAYAASRSSDPVVALVAAVARAVTGILQQAGIPTAGQGRILAQEVPAGAGAAGRVYRRLALPSLLPGATTETLAWMVRLANADVACAAGDVLTRDRIESLEALKKSLERLAPAGANMRHLIRAAHALDVPYLMLPMGLFQFGWARRSRLMRSTETDRTANIAASLVKNKLASSALLRSAGLPVPEHEIAPSRDAALAAARRIGFPVVIKPVDRDGGRGARAGLSTEQAVETAYEQACGVSPNIMVERHIEGEEYRLVVVDGELFSAHERIPARVVGDGRSSIRDLIADLNRLRRPGPSTGHFLVAITETEEVRELLAEQDLAPESIPAPGQAVRLQRSPSISGGGTGRWVLDIIHPDNRALAERAARLLRLDIAGIDFLTTDIARSWHETGGRITEVNTQPQISPLTRQGIFQDLVGKLLGGNGRIPLALVVTAGGDRTIADRVRMNLAGAGVHAGVACARRVTIGEDVIAAGMTSFQAAQALLTDPTVEAAVLFNDGGEILRDGLPFDRFDLLALPDTDSGADIDRAIAVTAPHLTGAVLASPSAAGIDTARRLVGAARVRAATQDVAGALCEVLAAGIM